MQRFTEIKVWQRSHQLTLAIYGFTKTFPADEKYGLVTQLRRAASSVPTNIAEGSKRRSNADYARFLNMAESSLAEEEYLLILAHDLGYVSTATVGPVFSEITEIGAMLNALRARVEEDAH